MRQCLTLSHTSDRSMPRLIEGVVSDFAQPGISDERPELTLEDMERYAEQLKNHRLVYDHEHPVHSTPSKPITKELTVGRIVDAWVRDDETMAVRVELDENEVGQRVLNEVESNFLTGFSLGLRHEMQGFPDGSSKCKKELVELSITPVPEFPNTSYVRSIKPLPEGSKENPLHAKLGDLRAVLGENYKEKVWAITASSGKRNAYTAQRSSEILADLKRRSQAAQQSQRTQVSEQRRALRSAVADKFSIVTFLNSQTAGGGNQSSKVANNAIMNNGQFQPPAGSDPQLDAHIEGLRSRRNDQGERAMAQGNTFQQPAPRSGVAPIHIHNYLDGTRRGARQQQLYSRQQQQRQQQQRRQQQAGHEQIMMQDEAYDDDEGGGDAGFDNDNGGDFVDEPQAPPARQQRQQSSAPSAQQQRSRQRRANNNYDEDDELPPPGPDEATERQQKRYDPEVPKPKTATARQLSEVEKKRRAEFIGAGGKFDDLNRDEVDPDEFEMFKQFRALKTGGGVDQKPSGKRKQADVRQQAKTQQAKTRQAEEDHMYLDIEGEAGNGDEDDDVDDKNESAEARLRRENAALRAKLSAKKHETNERVNSIKSKLNKPSARPAESVDDDNDALEEDEPLSYTGEGDDDDNKLNSQVNQLKELLQIDASGNSQTKEKFYDTIEELKEKRQQLLKLKHNLVDVSGDPSKKAKADKLALQKKTLEKELMTKWNELIINVREFQSGINRAHGQTTDKRQLDIYSDLIGRHGLPSEKDMQVLNSQIVAITASSEQSHNTLTKTLERFTREKTQREQLAFQAQEQAKLLGRHSDAEAAKQFVAGNDVLARSGQSTFRSPGAASSSKAFFVPRPGREAVGASGSYAGYDPVTRLPAGKSIDQMSIAEQTGIPFVAVNASNDVTKNTNLSHALRQKKPNLFAPGVPRDANLRVRRGVFRTGNTDLITAISASRAESGSIVSPNDFRRVTREAPLGAQLSPDGKFYTLPDPFAQPENGGQ